MANTLFSTVSRISPVHISNQFVTAAKNVFAGILIKGTTAGIKVYDDLDSVEDDFDQYGPFWKNARAYFTANNEAASLLALTYAPGTAGSVPAPTGLSVNPTTTGGTVTAQPAPAASTTLSADAAGAIEALRKYYFAGPQFWLLNEFDDEISMAVSNFIELQNTGVFLAYSTDVEDVKKYVANKRTYPMTLPEVDDSAVEDQDTYNNVFAAAFAGVEYGRRPHSAIKYALGELPYTKPQDRYDFTPSDMHELEKFNIATYAYVLDSPRMTSSRMGADGFHLDLILGWDWIQNEAHARVVNLFIQNAKQGIPYNEVGFESIINTIKGAFIDAGEMDVIAPLLDEGGNETGKPDYTVDYLKPGQLPKSYETKREVRGVKTKYRPMGMAEDVFIENTITL